MTKVKISNKDKNFFEKSKGEKSCKGKELGAVIENEEKNYPKTGAWKTVLVEIDKEKCVGCGICSKNCPEGVINPSMFGNKKIFKVDDNFCKGCGICVEVCPIRAIKSRRINNK